MKPRNALAELERWLDSDEERSVWLSTKHHTDNLIHHFCNLEGEHRKSVMAKHARGLKHAILSSLDEARKAGI